MRKAIFEQTDTRDLGGMAIAKNPNIIQKVNFRRTKVTDKTAIEFGLRQNLKYANFGFTALTDYGAKPSLTRSFFAST